MRLTFDSTLIHEVAFIRCKGRLTYGAETDALEKEVERHTKAPGTTIYAVKNVVLNLSEMEFVDSAGLGTLVRLLAGLRAAGGELKLCDLSPTVAKLIETTNLGSLFPEYASEAAAAEAFQVRGAWPSERLTSSKPRIVCLEPSKDLLAVLYALLSQAGYEVFTTRFVGDAVALASAGTPSVLICGPGIPPVESASVVIEKLRRSVKDVEILQLPADFHKADAGEAGQELLSRLQKAIAAGFSR